MVQDAAVRNLQVLSESTTRLSDGLKETEPNIPWPQLRGFRNILAHGYLNIDTDIVWKVIEKELPALDQAIQRMTKAVNRTSRPNRGLKA